MECVIIILTSAIAAKLFFERYKYSFILLLFRAFTVILSHYCYKYVLFPQTNGLDFVYNDELFFIAQLENIKNIHWNSVLFQLGTSNFYVFFLNIFKPVSVDIIFMARALSYLAFILAICTVERLAITFMLQARYRAILFYLLILSPTYIFFSSKVLRDMWILAVFLMVLNAYFQRKYIHTFLFLLILAFCRQPLALAVSIGLLFFILPGSFWLRFLICFSLMPVFFLLNVPLDKRINDFHYFFYNYPINLIGLNFLIVHHSKLIISFRDVLLHRLICPDIVLPQLLLIATLGWLRIKKINWHFLTEFYFLANIPYLFFYWITGFTSARQTVVPFIPIVYLQLLIYYQNHSKNDILSFFDKFLVSTTSNKVAS